MTDTTGGAEALHPARSRGLAGLWLPLGLTALVLIGLVGYYDPLAGAILLATPALPFLYYAVIKGLAHDRHFGALLATGVLFILSANFRFRDYGDKSIDFQVALKLLAIGAALAIGGIALRRIFRHLYLHGLINWLAFHLLMLLSALWAMNPTHAGISTISILATFLFICHLCVRYGPERMVEVMVWTGLVMCVGSLVVYVVHPELGRMKDWVGEELVLTGRLQGLFGASNGAGASAAVLLFLTVAFYFPQRDASWLVGYGTAITATLCLLLSNNRMALVSLIGSVFIYYILSGHFARKVMFLFSAGVLAVVPMILFADELLVLVSRSGDAAEIMSATGRTRIWAVVSELIWNHPFLGHGYASAQHILPLHPDLFVAAAHTHNLYLEVMFSFGLVGLFTLIWCVLTTFVLAFRVGGAREIALFSFFLIYGLTEPVIGATTYLGLMALQAALVLLFYRAKQRELIRYRS